MILKHGTNRMKRARRSPNWKRVWRMKMRYPNLRNLQKQPTKLGKTMSM